MIHQLGFNLYFVGIIILTTFQMTVHRKLFDEWLHNDFTLNNMIAITRMSNSILSKGNYFIFHATNDRELNSYNQQKTLTSLFLGVP